MFWKHQAPQTPHGLRCPGAPAGAQGPGLPSAASLSFLGRLNWLLAPTPTPKSTAGGEGPASSLPETTSSQKTQPPLEGACGYSVPARSEVRLCSAAGRNVGSPEHHRGGTKGGTHRPWPLGAHSTGRWFRSGVCVCWGLRQWKCSPVRAWGHHSWQHPGGRARWVQIPQGWLLWKQGAGPGLRALIHEGSAKWGATLAALQEGLPEQPHVGLWVQPTHLRSPRRPALP